MTQIDSQKCIGCQECVYVCTSNAISMVQLPGLRGTRASVSLERCVECGVCSRPGICPVNCISKTTLTYPRSVRTISDPTIKKVTGIPGRGTEEAKTNDVTGRFGHGEVGFCIDIGRPGVGTSMRDVQKIATALASIGIVFEKNNPCTAMMGDVKAGQFNKEVLDERALSMIAEFTCPIEKAPTIIAKLREVEPQLDTVFSLGLVSRFDDDGQIEALPMLQKLGITYRPNAKINVGLGRPLKE